MGVVHSSPDTNFVQEVEQLENQKNEAKDKESKEDIELKVELTRLERELAWSKRVSQGNNFIMDVVCYEKRVLEQYLTPYFVDSRYVPAGAYVLGIRPTSYSIIIIHVLYMKLSSCTRFDPCFD